jgi:FkbM family methyltransferase
LRKSLEQLRRDLARVVAPYPEAETLRHHLRRLIRRLDINCVLDVGAHMGQYAYLLREDVGFEGHIISFEPTASSFERLCRAMAGDPRWRGFPYALGPVSGVMDLNVFADATNLSSFLPPNRYGAERFTGLAGEQRRQPVAVHRLADVFDEVTAHVPAPRVLLKMDTQGFDHQVLEGGREVLHRVDAVQAEVCAIPIYQRVPPLWETLARLSELGFELTGMFPVTCDRDDLRVIEFDCTCIRVADGAREASPPRSSRA